MEQEVQGIWHCSQVRLVVFTNIVATFKQVFSETQVPLLVANKLVSAHFVQKLIEPEQSEQELSHVEHLFVMASNVLPCGQT
jgi:hypothetical protein